jgi:hypothetical protein
MTQQPHHPEQHAQWLNQMGITRWHATGAIALDTSESTAPIIAAPTETPTAPVPAPIAAEPQTYALPSAVRAAQYWLVGQSELDAPSASLLAHILKAIGATIEQVVYSFSSAHHATEPASKTVVTGVPSFSNILSIALPADALTRAIDLPSTTQLIFLGATETAWNAPQTKTPSLADMLAQPLKKRDAWQALKEII